MILKKSGLTGFAGLALLVLLLSVYTMVYGASTKKGVAHWASNFMCNGTHNDFDVLNNMSWWYDWRCNLTYFHDNNICTSYIDNYADTYVPMVWGFYHNTHLACHMPINSSYVLGPNEPNHYGQADLAAWEAGAYWPSFEGNSSGRYLVSPSAARCGSGCHGNTTEWFDQFFDSYCPNCRVDVLATHTYWCNVTKTMLFLEDLYNRYGKPIWLTEFACKNKKNSAAKQLSYMQKILPLLESAPYIERYAWYMARIKDDESYIQSSASLLENNSITLTPLGEYYNNFQP